MLDDNHPNIINLLYQLGDLVKEVKYALYFTPASDSR